LDIKQQFMGRRFWLLTALMALFVFILSGLWFYRSGLNKAETSLLKISNYMKTQCAAYTHYNAGAETQALLRAVESNREVGMKLYDSQMQGEEVSSELLESYADQLWLHGILILNSDGSILCSYARDTGLEEKLLKQLFKETVLTGSGYAERSYCQRIYFQNGGYINVAATSGKDETGMVISYYYISSESAKAYSLTLQSLLEGYQISTDGTIMVTDEGKVVACNDEALIGESTKENTVIQTLKENRDSHHICHIPAEKSYGVMLKQRDYYIYAYISEKAVFSSLLKNVLIVMVIYFCGVFAIWLMMQRSRRDYLKQEMEKEQKYKLEFQELARKADAANVAKTEFLQRMSHDIRTPINGICGMVEMAEHYADNLDKQAECRKKIRDASYLLLELINEVLDMGKLESGEVVLEQQPFDLQDVMDEVLVVIEKLASEQGLTLIREDFKVNHWKLIGSARHVKRLLMNIMSNAVKYNKENGTISIRCQELPSKEEGTALLEFICEDTGIGMSEAYQKKIFEPFTQENTGAQSKYGGSGLGMPIAKDLVEKMNGTLDFESEEGKGTTFIIRIPFVIDQSQEEKEKLNDSADKPSIQGYHILLVEDNELNMEIAEFVLEKEGAVVTKAWNGKEAVELFSESATGEYDAILMDMMMPVMDGYQAARTIRAMDREDAKTIPIIAMTANAFTEDRIKSREAGMNAHISKPLDLELLVETLHTMVSRL
jgi:two-component system, sensor histidine kinase